MNHISPLLAIQLLAALPLAATAGEITVSRADVVQPDAELLKTVTELRALSAKGAKKNIRKVEAFFAPDVTVFRRSLDPFQPWTRGDDIRGKYLAGVADVMVEQGEPPEGGKAIDYRLDAMKQLAALIPDDATYGTLPEAPGTICAPAAYKVDRKAALAFANTFELDAYSLRFFARDVVFADKPGSKKGIPVPVNTLIMFDYDPKAPEGWGHYETAGGIKGYMKDRDDTLGLAQHHVCFAKVKGKYLISAVFGYGL